MPWIAAIAETNKEAILWSPNASSSAREAASGSAITPSSRRRSEISGWRLAALVVVWLVAAAVPAAADNVDIVHLKNGDRLTCEIKLLDRSLLTISTDPLGKANVHWGEIAAIASPRTFDIQVASGEHYAGALALATSGRLTVVVAGGPPVTLAMGDIIRMAPIGASIWSRMDGSVDAGFSFAQADLETHYTLNGASNYRSQRYQFGATLASQLTTREDSDRISRNSIGLNGNRSFGNRWYTTAWAQLQQNEELSLDLRVVGGGGVGRDVSHTVSRLFQLFGGIAYTRERFSREPADQSAEAALGGQVDFFTPGKEDFKITNSVLSYFNVSGRARVRLELQSAWRHEFLKDFYWSMNGFESFDSDPPAEQKNNDAGFSFTLGWKF